MMATDYSPMPEPAGPQLHPYVHDPLLYIGITPSHVTDENLAGALQTCAPFRLNLNRDPNSGTMSGTIEFKFLDKAEKALATLQSRPIPGLQPSVLLTLSPYPPTNPPTPLPPPNACPRLVKQLPPGYTDSQLYDLFRPFGALASVRTQTSFGKDTGVVEFWREEDARQGEEAMHCADVEGYNIVVQMYQQRRAGSNSSEFSPSAPAFVPSGSVFPYPQQYSPHSPHSPHSPPRPLTYSPRGQHNLPFIHGPGQQVQVHQGSHSGLIDPCNLFIKNLDAEIDSNALFAHFRQFGQIVSARVMRNENGESRGFGFVSYQTPDQAANAMQSMNGVVLGSKPVVVRLHEPKQLRQEKLAARFAGQNGHPRSASGATSPTASEGGESYAGWGSPRMQTSALGSPPHNNYGDHPHRLRRGSGSYYNAALAGTLNVPMRYDDLAALSPVVRKEVLMGELNRRVKSTNNVAPDEVNSIVESLVSLSLSDVVNVIHDQAKLTEHIRAAQNSLLVKKTPAREKSPSPSASQDSRLLDANTLNATASAPEHPSTPISVSPAISTPPRTSSPSGSVAPGGSERDRMYTAVCKLESSKQAELTELMMSLPKRDRALCLFNIEVLRAKIQDAKVVLDSDDGEEDPVPVPMTPQAREVSTRSLEESPRTPDLSSRGPSVAGSPTPATPDASSAGYTIVSLARLSAVEIVKIANSPSATGLPLPKADPLVVRATDEFVDGLRDKPIQQQKQAVGDKLWRVIKAFGIKGAPKLTIALLDQEELRSLAHLMNSYPSVLKEKALLAQAATLASK
ncbi:hypothetical protein NEOLEDRAFT_339077 [Neolentinus lepideus HHB14362 ss-1]|uniref:RRM domain-containing protein n=1 Tax=Neolentinus lepideus HHB14362 ss-1 TaxID=1314782 RepID=A0A165SW34_9AGAM|nr:hypothetical protein NEOLEDRAFT_339077 [Neolentinus lepideus HHB14362 ss-1]